MHKKIKCIDWLVVVFKPWYTVRCCIVIGYLSVLAGAGMETNVQILRNSQKIYYVVQGS